MEYNKEYAKKVYAGLSKRGYTEGDLGSEDLFVARMGKENNRRLLYDMIARRGDANVGSWERFNERMSVPDIDKSQYTFTERELGLGGYQLGQPIPIIEKMRRKETEAGAGTPMGDDIYRTKEGQYTRTEVPFRTIEYPSLGMAQMAARGQQREDALAAYRSAYNRLEAPGEVDERTLIEWGNNMDNAPIEQKNLYSRIMGQDATNRVDLDAVMRSYDETKKSLEGVENPEGLAAYLMMPAEQKAKLPEDERNRYEGLVKDKRKTDAVDDVNELHERISSLMEKQRVSDVKMRRDYLENRSTGQAIKDAILAASVADTPQLQGIVPSSGLEATPEGKQSNEQNAALTAAGRKWNEMKYIINAAKDGNIFDGLDKALGSVDTWTSDQMLRDNMAIMRVANKFDREGEGALTDNEKALLDALALNVAVSEMYGDEISNWYKGGEMLGEMAPFMLEMLMNPLSGLGKKAADKVTRKAIEKYGKELVKKNAKKFALTRGAAKLGASVAGATGMALTTGLPAVGAGTQQRMLGNATYDYDNEGNVVYTGHKGGEESLFTAAREEVTSRMLDNVSEMLGAGYAGMPFKWLQKAGKGTKLLGWIDNLANSKFGKGVSRFAEKTKWNGPIEEFLEEVHVGLLNPALVGDQSWEEFFTADNLATIAIGVAVPGTVISTANTIAGAADGAFKVGAQERWKMKNAEAMGYQLWQDNPNEWNDLTRSLMVGQMEDIEKTLKEVYNNPNLTPEQKKTALEYGVYSLQWRTAKGVEEAFNEGKKFIDPMLRDVYGTAYAERVSPVQANNAYKAMVEAEKSAQRVLGIGDKSIDEWLGGRTAEEAAMSSKEKLAAIKAYQTAKLDFEGRRDRYIAEKERAYMESDRSIQTNDNNGMVYATQLKDEPVYITGGNVVLNEDGTIDVNNSSEALYVKFPDGHVEMTSPDKFTEVFTEDKTADLKAAKRAEIDQRWRTEFDTAEAQSVEQEKRDSGVVFDMTDAQGEHRIEILNEGEKMSDILLDGAQMEIPTEELNRWKQEAGIQSAENGVQSVDAVVDNTTDNVAPTGDNVAPVAPVENNEPAPVELPDVPDFFRLGGTNYEVASRNDDGSVDVMVDGKRETLPAGTDYSTLMPTDKKGEVQYEQIPVERTHEYFVQKVKDDEARAEMIEKRRKKAEAERKKFDKKPDPGIDPDAYEAKMTQWEADKKAAQAKVDYWNEVAKRDAEITRSETREAVNNIKPDVVEETADEFIANQLAGIKITPESFKRETGLSNAEQAQLVGVISNDGVSVERAAEIILENYDSELKALGFTGDMQDVRDIIIDVLSQGNPRSYARKGREAREAENVDQQRADAEAWAKGAFDMKLEELYLYEETILPRIIRDYEGFDENEYYSNLAENNGYDTTRESESIGRGSELLQGEQPVPAGGTPVVGQRNEGGAVSDDVQGGGQDGVAQEEVPVNEPVGNSEQLSSSEIPNNQSVAEGSAPGQSGVVDNNSANALQNGNNELNLQKENESDNESNQNDIPIGGQVSQPVPQGEHGTQTSQVSGAQEVAARLRERIESAQGDSKSGLREVENRVTREFAQENGLWIENETELGTPFPSGDEHNNYIDAENQVVYKVNNRMHTPSILDLLDRIEQHNKYFPDSKYSLVGFTSVSKNGDVLPVFAQDFVSDARMATVDEIDSYMGTLGFTRVGDGRYSNGEVVIKDLKPRNVLADADGDIYVVDAEFEQENSVKSGETAENGGKIQEPRSVEENLDNGDKKITSYNSRGEVATVVIERDGKVVSVDSYDEGVLFEHTEYDGNGKATSVTRYDKQGNVVGTQVYEDGKAKTPMQKLADQVLGRTEEKRRIPLRERARELEAQVGVKANVIESLDEVKNREARERIAAGEAVAGWYSGGQVYLYMPNIKDKREIELTYVHEVVAHHGVKKLLGERFNEFLDGVWKMMSEADRARMLAYVGAENPTLQDMRAAADEYVAELAEKMNLGELEQSTWDKIVDWFKELLENIGFENLTKEDIESMLKASYSNLRAESGKGKTGSTENGFRARIQEDAESKKIFETAKEIFGTTYDMREAGYILPDGTMLDFSGKHQVRSVDNSFLNGGRTVDHREIEDIAYDFDENPTGVSTDMGDFLDRGAIRIDYNVGAINLNTAPTAKQKALLKRLIERNDGDVTIDFGKGWDTEHYAEYESARASRVLGDIDRYYSEGIKPGGNTMFRIAEVNDKFNSELESLNEENADKVVLNVGNPSPVLLSAGVEDRPMKLYGNKIIKKAKKHGFKIQDLKNLPSAVADPIAVFDNYQQKGNRSILTELRTADGNILATVDLGKGMDIDFNIISSAFGKSDNKIVSWINKGFATYINKEKALDYLHLSAPIAEASDKQELSFAAKIVESFENPTVDSENSSENPQDAENGIRFRKKDSERRQEKRRINDAIDTAAGFITVGGKKQATKNRLKKEAERKQLAKEMYSSVLKGDFNDVTLSQIDKFIEDATPANPFGRRISQRLPQRMERVLRQGARTNAVDALFSRICESTVPANERFSEAGRREIEERKKELLKGWAIATGNWHTDLKEFTDDTEPIGEGKDSKVYMSKDGNSVIKASKGKPFGKKFRPDIDNIPLFNDVFKNSRYEILGYGEIDGQFVRILKQDFIDFAESTPLTPEERKEYMGKLGFKPLNKDYTAFSNGEIVIADLQKSNIVKDAAGNISVIDADAKLHTKDVGGDYTYPPVEEDLPEDSDTRFRIANENQDVFVSNAQRAVEGIQQNKATAEQWIAMLKKNGGLKAGEDAWLGLEEWLNEKQGAVTKQEILDYIGENKIQIEEVNYQGSEEDLNDSRGLIAKMRGKDFADEFLIAFDIEYGEFGIYDEEKAYELYKRENGTEAADEEEILAWAEGVMNEAQDNARPINSTRLDYTTEGLENKREIALTVPTIEPYNASDEVHFGDAGEGRAVAWVRFGETTVYETVEDVQEVTELHEPYRGVNGHDIYKPVGSFRSGDYIVHGKAKTGEMIYVVYINDKQIPIAHATLEEARNAMNEYYREHPRKLRKPVRVLVIDEIQSKRHQEGREKGYRSNADKFLKDNGVEIVETDTYFEFYKNGEVDKRFAKGLFNTDIEKAKNLYVAGYEKTAIPSAPFEKNWHELAIKRMLRLAAEEGFDKVAWTTGEQQAERYSLGTYINSIERFDVDDRGKRFELNGPARIGMTVGDDGVVIASSQGEYEGKPLSDVVGKELAEKMLAMENRAKLEDLDLKVGGEGMKGFYDRMLPSFVQKYTKKWGAKVGEVTMPSLEENNTMWSVDVTPEMQESVMQGQTMFRFIGEKGAANLDRAEEATTRLENLSVAREMETAGKEAKAIKLATGWERGADGKWRYETEDAKVKDTINIDGNEFKRREEDMLWTSGLLKDVIDAPGLFEAYPELEKVRLDADPITGNYPSNGEYNPRRNMITIHADEVKYLNSILNHEIQHVIQHIEGFAKGGDEKTADYIKNKARVWAWRNALKETEKEHPELAGTTELEKVLMDEYRTEGLEEYIPTEEQRIKGFNLYARGYDGEGYEQAFNQMQNVVAGNGFATYKRLAGEVESRNVQERMNMSAEERRASLAAETEDVARKDQIFIYDALESAMMGSRVDARMAEVAAHFEGKQLTAEQQAVVDVFGGKADNLTISVKTKDGNERRVVMRQGNEMGAGAKHSLFRHFGMNNGAITADDILLIPEILANGERVEKKRGKKTVIEYKYTDNNGVEYTVITENNKGREEFANFYTNRKASSAARKTRSEEARDTADDASEDKGSDNSSNTQEGEARFRTVEETTDGSIDDVPAQPLTLMERIANSLLEVSAKNKENLELRASALRTFGRDINRVLSLMKAQREYDKSTVDTLVKLAKMYFKNAQLLGEVDTYTMGRVLSLINNVVGKRDVTASAAKLMDILLDAHTKALAGILDKAEKVKAKKVNAAGVEVMGRLDKYGQKRVDEYRAAKGMTPEKLEEAIYDSDNRLAELEQRVREVLGIPDGDVDLAAREYTGDNDVVNVYMDERARLEGLTLAREYKESIQQVQEEIKDLKRELKQAEEDYRLGNIDGKSLKEFRKSVAEAIMESKAELIEGYHSLIYKFQENTKESSQRAKEFAQAQIDRAREIQHNANSDMEGIPADTQGTHPDNHNNAVMNALRSPFPTFQGMLKKFGEKNVEGKGYLYERFMPQATQASDNEFRGKVAARVMIETKLKEIYGEKANIAGFMKELREYGATVTYREGNEMKQFDLTKGQMLYIYMVNKMADGQMKLRRMGITDDVVAELMTKLPEEAVQFADWAQNELLKDLRGKYNAVHERVFGAPMAAIENYFPIKIRKEARGEKGDVSEVGQEGKPSTVTGSIIKRTKNATAIDLSADAMQVLMEHIDDMEHWAAFAEFNRDLNVLLNYKHFQNQVKNMTSVRYGSGEEMWKNFKKTAQIVSGTYRPSDSSIDRAVQNIAKGLTRSKINFRLYTAIKQLLSAPAFWTDAGVEELAYCYANPKGSFKWALENLPGFAERWQGRTMGNEKLLKSDSDWELWRNEFVEKATRWGMTPNAAIDALTVAQGARAVYMTKLEQFKKAGYTEQRANEKALQAAAEAYNESQQSSEGIYLSPLQVEGTVASAIFSTFKNSNFGYTRKTAQAVANIKRKMRKGYKEETIAFMTKQMIRDGLSEENAKRMAEKVYNRSKYKDVANVAMFGFGLNLLWEAGGMAIYLLLGDDDEEKEKMMKEIALRGSLGLLNGVPFGETMISAAMAVKEGDTKYFRLPELVAVSDIKNLAQVLNYDPVRGANDIVNMLVSMGVGVTPQVLTDILVAFGDVEEFSAEELGMFVARFMNAPQSNLDRLMVDDAMEDSAINADEIMRRYAEYKKSKNAPITQFLYPDAIEQKALERYMKRFNKMLDERLENVVEDNDAYDLFYKGADARMKSELAKMRQNYLAEDKAEAFEKMDAKELVERVLYGSGEINEAYFNLSTAEDEDDAFVLKSVLKELNDLVEEGMQTDEEEQLLKDLKRKDNIINKAKRLMKQQPDKAQEHMNNIRKKRAEAIKQINNYRKDE